MATIHTVSLKNQIECSFHSTVKTDWAKIAKFVFDTNISDHYNVIKQLAGGIFAHMIKLENKMGNVLLRYFEEIHFGVVLNKYDLEVDSINVNNINNVQLSDVTLANLVITDEQIND